MRRVKRAPSPSRCVYILECRGQYKIGRTSNLPERIKGLQIGNPFPMKTVHVIWTDSIVEVETALHAILGESRTQGEWFNLSVREISAIASMSVDDILIMGKKPEKPAVIYSRPVDPNQSSFGWDS